MLDSLVFFALLLPPISALAQQGASQLSPHASDHSQPQQSERHPVVSTPPAPAAEPSKPADSTGYPIDAQGWGGKVGKTWQARWMDDFSYLKDTSKRKDFFDPVKYIPLNEAGDVYVSLSSELRLRNNTTSDPGLVPGANSQHQYLFRAFLGADLHVGEHFRVYAEAARADMDGRNEGNHATSQDNEAFLQQAFFDVSGKLNGADSGFRFGRQLFIDGPPPLMAARDNTNLFRTFNGARFWMVGENHRLDLFELRYMTEGPNGFGDDKPDDGRRFRGAVLGWRIPGNNKLFLDPFWYSQRLDSQRWGGSTAREIRDFYGVRFYGNIGNLRTENYASLQRGSFGNRDLRAWSISSSNSWPVGKHPWKPRLGFHVDVASGGGGFGTGDLKNSSFLYGNVLYFDWSTFFGATNLVAYGQTLTFQPVAKMTVSTEWEFLWRQNEEDAVYTGQSTPYARTQNQEGKYIGSLPRINIAYNINDHWSLVWRAERLLTGDMMRQAGYGNSSFMAAWVNFRF